MLFFAIDVTCVFSRMDKFRKSGWEKPPGTVDENNYFPAAGVGGILDALESCLKVL
jgi:hypothetical protein